MSHKKTQCEQEIFVVNNLKTNLLGLPAITELQLNDQLHNICTSADSVKQPFPFTGLGTISVDYEIKLQRNTKPCALHTAYDRK